MSNFHTFFKYWNNFPIFPQFIFDPENCEYNIQASRRRKIGTFIYFLIGLIFALINIWNHDSVDMQLLRIFSVITLLSGFAPVFIFYKKKSQIEDILRKTTILLKNAQLENLSELMPRDSFQIRIFYLYFELTMILLQFILQIFIYIDDIFLWNEIVVIHISNFLNLQSSMFNLLIQSNLVNTITCFIVVLEKMERWEYVCKIENYYFDILSIWNQIFAIFSLSIFLRCSYFLHNILLDVFYCCIDTEYLNLTPVLFLYCFCNSMEQVIILAMFIHGGRVFSRKVILKNIVQYSSLKTKIQ